jgi:hypothetical protein
MLEQWNNEVTRSGKMGCWFNGKIRFDDIIKNG